MSHRKERKKVQVISKRTSEGICGVQCSYGVSRLQGKRPSMEDRTLILPMVTSSMAVFGVFDGHDGAQAAEFTIRKLTLVFEDLLSEVWSGPEELFKRLMEEIDNKFCAVAVSKRIYSGTTALITVIVQAENGDRRLVVSNVGDSRAFLCVQGKAKSVSICHKPEMEVGRITDAGGWLCEEREMTQLGECVTWRLNGGLSLSRAIGDVEYKRLKNVYAKSAGCDWDFPSGHSKNFAADLVIAEPDVYVHDMEKEQ
ncbi:uncharacterized protein LOC134197288 isoform X2 [Corticium candelabrum]|uniref:uncharacterized protein LOC134197288 isoform X2 n=1 Tax=Corticium candelabrum TaxID=121492 RepID=UPI002E25537B|nr:uncharacterized protein LOC134197288 isoform X2 [Corticium candelabrum]